MSQCQYAKTNTKKGEQAHQPDRGGRANWLTRPRCTESDVTSFSSENDPRLISQTNFWCQQPCLFYFSTFALQILFTVAPFPLPAPNNWAATRFRCTVTAAARAKVVCASSIICRKSSSLRCRSVGAEPSCFRSCQRSASSAAFNHTPQD